VRRIFRTSRVFFFEGQDLPPWTESEIGRIRERHGIVFDVEGGGTYLSRRRLQLPKGRIWVSQTQKPSALFCHLADHALQERMGYTMDGGYCFVSRDPSVLLGPIGVCTHNDHIIHVPPQEPLQRGEHLKSLDGKVWRVTPEEWDAYKGKGTKLTSVTEWGDGFVVPTEWIATNSFYFAADTKGTSLSPWLPRGDYRRINSFTLSGVVYVFDPSLPPGYIFPSANDMTIMACDLGSSLVVYDPHSNAIRAEACYDSYQTKANRPLDYVIKSLKNVSFVQSFDSPGLSSPELVKLLPRKMREVMKVKDVTTYLMRISDVCCWRKRNEDYEWVHFSSLSVHLPGAPPDPPDSLRLEGNRLSAVLSLARNMRKTTWYTYHDIFEYKKFFNLLELNGAAYHVVKKGQFLKRVKITWW